MLWRSVDLAQHTVIGVKRTVLGLSMNLPFVYQLKAHRVTFTADVVEPLFRRLRALRQLDLAEATLPPNAVQQILKYCPNLEMLSLAHCKSVQMDDLADIAKKCRLASCILLFILILLDAPRLGRCRS